MPVSGNYGTPANPLANIWSEFWELQFYTTSDPAHVEGDLWGRSDLNSGDKIATLRFDNGTSVIDIPVFPATTDPSSSSIKKVAGVQTPNGEGWMPILENGGAYSYLGYQHGGARHGVHDSLTAIPDSAISRWTFDNDDTSGSTAIDSWGANDGSITGATTGVSGANQTYTTNEGYGFDGTDDLVDVGNLGFDNTTSFSVAAWINIDIGGGTAMGRYDGTDDLWQLAPGDQWRIGHVSGDEHVINATSPTTGTWAHIVATFDAQTPESVLYQDASSVGSATGPVADFSTSNPVYIGNRGGEGNPMDGTIDDVRLYSKSLSSTEVSNLYNTGSISG